MMKAHLASLLIVFTLSACGGGGDNTNTPETSPTQSNAQAYVDQVVSIMRENVITRNRVNWSDLESRVNALASGAQTIQATYPAINKALELIDTNHSFIVSNTGQFVAYYSELECDLSNFSATIDDEDIGYISVGAFSGSSAEAKRFATDIQTSIAAQDGANIKGWIVDLRNNTGGNMWPMVAGLGPLLGEGIHGYFVDANERFVSWSYQDGASRSGGQQIVSVDSPYTLLNPVPKIAVLSSQKVASSGEATLISFKKKYNVRIFGQSSCGLSTSNQAFPLLDGSELFLTTGIMADSEQEKYGGPVGADENVAQSEVVQAAIDWINQ